MQLSVLIISHNTRALTLDCLRSVYEQTSGIEFEVIVLDNASTDGSAAAIAEQFPQVRLLEPGRNLGFAAGNNLAAQDASGKVLLLLNPDTVILDRAIERLLSFADSNADAGIYGGRTLYPDGSLNRESCHGRPTPWSLLCMGLGLSSLFRKSAIVNPEGLGSWRRDSARPVDCVTGCFLLIHRHLWDLLRGFDESFFMYGEDTDLCMRATAAGYPCLHCPDAQIIHYGGKSDRIRADKMVRLFRAKAQLFEKHWPPHMVGFGIRMLQLWALTRTVATRGAMLLGRDCRASHEAWREIFRRRAEFSTAFSASSQSISVDQTDSAEPASTALSQ